MSVAATRPSHSRVRWNTVWNLVGLGIPLAVAFFCVPPLIAALGVARYGVLSFAVLFLNYFVFLDLGIGRALTQLLAGPARGDPHEESALIWTVSGLVAVVGSVAAVGVFFLAPGLVDWLRMPDDLRGEAIPAVRLLGAALPFLLHGLAMRGVLEARHRFDLSNLVRLPAGVFTFGAPLLVLPFTHHLAAVVGAILSGRLLAWGLNLYVIARLMPHVARYPRWKGVEIWGIMRIGAWYSVSNVVIPVIEALDRFFIGRLMSVSMVTYYATPYDLIVRLGILSGSMAGAMFPEFAARMQRGDDVLPLFRRGVKYLLSALFPFLLVATAYAQEGLAWWLGNPEFAALSAPVLRAFALFVFLGGAALMPLTLLQGAGRPDLSARVHLVELPVQAVLLYFLIRLDGIRGAALACALRMAVDYVGLLVCAGRLLKLRARDYARLAAPVAAGVAALLPFHFAIPSGARSALAALLLLAFAVAAWRFVLEPRDKSLVRRALRLEAR